MRQRGFQEDSRPGAPLCRWCTDDLILDLMPTQGEILGFSNRWYPLALETAQLQGLPSGCAIRIVTAPVFLATKLEAFRGRGQGNFLFSHDLEDPMAVVDGRASLLVECRLSPLELRNHLAAQFLELLKNSAFLEALPAANACPPSHRWWVRWPHRWNGWSRCWWGEAERWSALPEPLNPLDGPQPGDAERPAVGFLGDHQAIRAQQHCHHRCTFQLQAALTGLREREVGAKSSGNAWPWISAIRAVIAGLAEAVWASTGKS